MRFVGLVMALTGIAVAYFFGITGTGNPQADMVTARSKLAQLLNLPGLAATPSSPSAAGSSTPAALKPITGNIVAPARSANPFASLVAAGKKIAAGGGA